MTAASRVVTYSSAYTLVPTYECFNRCSYCNFRADPGKSPWLTLADAEVQMRSLRTSSYMPAPLTVTLPRVFLPSPDVIEILILSGEVHPQSSRRAAWFEHIYNLCELALGLGFLPHTNAGPLSRTEMERLKTVNVSMGLMLEQLTPNLLRTVHRHAPSKLPDLRLQQLVWAGELQIPFTTGILLGIGETAADRRETLEAIARVHNQWQHIQEVILQPYSPGQDEVWSGSAFSPKDLVEAVAIARHILPADITLQIPPNLIQEPDYLIACLEAGARDLGGIGPRDEVNPDYPHPMDAELTKTLAASRWQLVLRLPVYPQYDEWLSEPLQTLVARWRSRIDNKP